MREESVAILLQGHGSDHEMLRRPGNNSWGYKFNAIKNGFNFMEYVPYHFI